MMLPVAVPNYMQPKITYDNNGNAVMLPQPFMEITAPREVDLNRVQISDSDLKSSPSKSGKHNIIVEENIRIHKEAENEAWKQNVLLTKERSLCAKLSDMGISKLVLEDMSSLVHSSTGEYKSLCFSALWIWNYLLPSSYMLKIELVLGGNQVHM
ncbi:hypothetical protein MTR_6g065690 [Medicago truncatula]|uniref:Uncharacterized protein n=1 Tax=Medicago truncatula TaxID=3880 RepID=G7KPA4_MEDTR|nr:hypothetical protein MTR_6g065690 [Medicago truncatula]